MRAIDEQIENDGKHSVSTSTPDERQPPLAALLDERVVMTDLLDLPRSDLMAPNVADIPRIPDQAANFEPADGVQSLKHGV